MIQEETLKALKNQILGELELELMRRGAARSGSLLNASMHDLSPDPRTPEVQSLERHLRHHMHIKLDGHFGKTRDDKANRIDMGVMLNFLQGRLAKQNKDFIENVESAMDSILQETPIKSEISRGISPQLAFERSSGLINRPSGGADHTH